MASIQFCRLAYVILVLAALPADLIASPPSESLLGFLSSMSGVYNEEPIDSDDYSENLSEKAIPVRIPAFDPSFTFLYEETVDGAIYRRHIFAVSEGEDGIIYAKPYNITAVSLTQEVDLDSLQALPLEAFTFDPDCVLQYRRVSGNTYFGTWPDCNVKNEGTIPMYTSVWTCDSESFIVREKLSKEGRNRLPFIMRKQGPEVPLLPYMTEGVEDFVNPCQANYP